MIHRYPGGDLIEHELTGDRCVCGPTPQYRDPETFEAHPDPVMIHHSLDGREFGLDTELHALVRKGQRRERSGGASLLIAVGAIAIYGLFSGGTR